MAMREMSGDRTCSISILKCGDLLFRTVFSFNGNVWERRDDLITGRADHACVEYNVCFILHYFLFSSVHFVVKIF